MTEPDARKFAPATQRNREPILTVLQQVLPAQGLILEIASGSGEHAVFFAPKLAPRYWLPSDHNSTSLDSIQAWQQQHPIANLLPPVCLEMNDSNWVKIVQRRLEQFPLAGIPMTAMVNINMIHISPWRATLGLMAGAETLLPVGGVLYLYGPYKKNGVHTAPSNEAFDEMLRSQNPEWGVRNLEDVIEAAAHHRLYWRNTIAMPANNLSVIFERGN